jgi:hypothetical protein
MLFSRSRGASLVGLSLAFALASACSTADAPTPTGLQPSIASLNQSEGRGVLQRYFAIGTSVSMGWQSDGVVAATQATSWPAQLAALGGRTLDQPYIDGTGCRSPLRAPLGLFLRLSGESAFTPTTALSCSPLRPDVQLPVDNVAISGALTADALFTTPENTTDPVEARLYSRVLQPNHTQVSTMVEQNPKLVSVELGANEVLGAISGVAVPGLTIVPLQIWQPLYDQVLDKVGETTKMAVLVGLMDDLRNFPAFRSGDDLWQDRLEFAGANVALTDCAGSQNMVFVPFALPPVLAAAKVSPVPVPFSCTASLNPLAPDFILTPGDINGINAQMHAMSAHIQAEAIRRGYAYFDLGALYDRPNLKAQFSLTTVLTSLTPFGSFISLDGVHPTAKGAAILAGAAAHALNATYKLGIPE